MIREEGNERKERQICRVEMEKGSPIYSMSQIFKMQLPQRFSLFGETGLESLSQHGGKTRCVWSKMQRDIRAGNWLIGENSICEPCFVSGRGGQPSATGLPRPQLTGCCCCCCWDSNCVQHHCFQKETYNVAVSKNPFMCSQVFGSVVVHV